MGASAVASQVIMFIAVLGITTGLVVVFNDYVDKTTSSANMKMVAYSMRLKTDVTITSVSYQDLNPDEITLYVLNTGKTPLKVNQTDVYLEGFIPRNNGNRTLTLEPSTDNIDVGIWNEKEVLKIVVFKDLSSSTTYDVCIGTQYGTQSCDSFSTS